MRFRYAICDRLPQKRDNLSHQYRNQDGEEVDQVVGHPAKPGDEFTAGRANIGQGTRYRIPVSSLE